MCYYLPVRVNLNKFHIGDMLAQLSLHSCFVDIIINVILLIHYTLLHKLACNIASYCSSGHGIFTSRRRVKMQSMSGHRF